MRLPQDNAIARKQEFPRPVRLPCQAPPVDVERRTDLDQRHGFAGYPEAKDAVGPVRGFNVGILGVGAAQGARAQGKRHRGGLSRGQRHPVDRRLRAAAPAAHLQYLEVGLAVIPQGESRRSRLVGGVATQIDQGRPG